MALGAAPVFWTVAHFLWGAPRAALWVGAIILGWGMLSSLAPVASAPLLRGWMRVTMPIGAVVTAVVLGAVYYLVLTPLALVRRAGNRDPLDKRWDPARGGSAWRAKRLPPPGDRRWYRPF